MCPGGVWWSAYQFPDIAKPLNHVNLFTELEEGWRVTLRTVLYSPADRKERGFNDESFIDWPLQSLLPSCSGHAARLGRPGGRRLPALEHDFGTIFQGENVRHAFVFTNSGDAPLTVEKVSSSCGCTVALASAKVLAAGNQRRGADQRSTASAFAATSANGLSVHQRPGRSRWCNCKSRARSGRSSFSSRRGQFRCGGAQEDGPGHRQPDQSGRSGSSPRRPGDDDARTDRAPGCRRRSSARRARLPLS